MKDMKKGMSGQYVAATGSPFSDADAAIIGRELTKIATKFGVADIRTLDKHVVFAEVEADKSHPLRAYLEQDIYEAFKARWLEQISKLIRSVRVVQVTIDNGKRKERRDPLFVHVEKTGRGKGKEHLRSHVLTQDAIKDDPTFSAVISAQIRQLRDAANRLDHIVSCRKVLPPGVKQLSDAVQDALHAYAKVMDTAAE